MLERTWIRLGLCAIIFYINYFLLVDRLLFTKRLFLLIIFNLVLITGCLGINEWMKDVFDFCRSNVSVMLVGTKSDLINLSVVDSRIVEFKAQEYGKFFLTTS